MNSKILVMLCAVLWVPAVIFANPTYVGAIKCGSCHQDSLTKWQLSHHAKAMGVASEKTVLGNFKQKVFKHENVKTTFSKRGENFSILIEEQGFEPVEYNVVYTFGVYPLQQYLLDIGGGKYQAYDVAWDSRTQKEGGQRWYKLLPDEDTSKKSLFHWSKQVNNWNSRCADCHSTGLQKNYQLSSRTYETTFSEINVACESCHGAGSQHVKIVKSGQYSKQSTGFKTNLRSALPFKFVGKQTIATPEELAQAKIIQQGQVDACGGCHSRRQVIAEHDPSKDYHDQYLISLLDDPLYHADGQILDEVFVLGSYMQSKMYQKGVSCTHCHDAHSGQVKSQTNNLCTQCHAPSAYDVADHHRHKINTEGSQCVNCHMPTTTYMEVDDRRDHSFQVPTSGPSELGPSACVKCHEEQVKPWKESKKHFSILNQKSRQSDPLALRDMVTYIHDVNQPAMRRATLLEQSASIPSRLTAEAILKELESDSPLLRRAAVNASAILPLDMRWSVLKNYMVDASGSVRYAVATQLSPVLPHLQPEESKPLLSLLQEHHTQLLYSSDLPGGQGTIANTELSKGNTAEAISALNHALAVEPDYLPARLNLADVYRSLENVREEKIHLDRALASHPQNAAANHSYGLYLVRQGETSKALPYLKKATEMEFSQSRYSYVLAVAFESTGNLSQAIETLKKACIEWPNQYNLLLTLVLYLEKANREVESWDYLSKLTAIAPNDPEVKRRVQSLQNR